MSTTYKVQQGDTYEIISRRAYGSEKHAPTLAAANPNAVEPLSAGTSIVIPDLQGAPVPRNPQISVAGENEVALLIEGFRFRFWTDIRLTRSIDKFSTATFRAPFDTDSAEFREVFRPFSFKPVKITVGDAVLFNGTIVSIVPEVDATSKSVTVAAYSKPGVLSDCSAAAVDRDSLEFFEFNIKEIATKLAQPFGIDVVFDGAPGDVFDLVAVPPERKLLNFLTNLAQKRNFVITSTDDGKLLFHRSKPAGVPVARLTQGEAPLISVTPSFKSQEYYSHVTGVDPLILGLEGSSATVKNNFLSGVVRPITFKVEDAINANIQGATEAKIARMFANAASYVLKVATWRDAFGDLWRPNTTVEVFAPNAMVYNAYSFIIRSVTFDIERDRETATLELVMPGAFEGKQPESLPWV